CRSPGWPSARRPRNHRRRSLLIPPRADSGVGGERVGRLRQMASGPRGTGRLTARPSAVLAGGHGALQSVFMNLRPETPDPLAAFHPAVQGWFRRAFAAPTPAQVGAWPSIRAGRSTLVAAPTGSGKTLTAFLATLDELLRLGLAGALEDRTRVVYVSPLKALSNDIHLNLEVPLAGIAEELALEVPPVPLEAVMSNEAWELVYDRLAELIRQRRTTLVFVNTRRLAERVARHLSERLGEAAVAAHHGSLARDQR